MFCPEVELTNWVLRWTTSSSLLQMPHSPTNDTSQYTVTYLGWRTGLCCHHGWPETSLPLSETSETVKHSTHKQTVTQLVT